MEGSTRRTTTSKNGAAARRGVGAWGGAALALLVVYLTHRFWIAPWLSSLPTEMHGRPEPWLVFIAQIVVIPNFVVRSGWSAMGWAQRHWELSASRPHRSTFVLYSCVALALALLGVPTLGLEGAMLAASIAIGFTGYLSNSPSKLKGSTEPLVK